MFGEMIDSILPAIELLFAEATATSNKGGFGFPAVHGVDHLATMDQPQMLPQMVLPVKRTSVHALLLASPVVVRLNVIIAGVRLSTIHALPLTSRGCGHHWTNWSTDPLLQTEMERFLMP